MHTSPESRTGGRSDLPLAPPYIESGARFDSATVVLIGDLSSHARLALRTGRRRTILILLRDRDRLVCEDLARQLREMLRVSDRIPAVLATERDAVTAYRSFARREHIRSAVVVLSADSVLAAGPVPTPAVLLLNGPAAEAQGVAHPSRFPNVRLRSFAAEIQPLLR
jgi:hypothetical protein